MWVVAAAIGVGCRPDAPTGIVDSGPKSVPGLTGREAPAGVLVEEVGDQAVPVRAGAAALHGRPSWCVRRRGDAPAGAASGLAGRRAV